MPVRADELDALHSDFRSWNASEPSAVEAIANELTKSYGFGRNDDGTWDWSVDRIAQSFRDEPLWTTLDYLTLAVPVAKWATSVRAVKAGSLLGVGRGGRLGKALGGVLGGDTVVRKALEGGAFAGQQARGEGGFLVRQLNRLVDPETARAAEAYRAGPGRLSVRFGKRNIGLTNPLTAETTDEWSAWVNRYDGEVWERRAVTRAIDKERAIEESGAFRAAADVQGEYTKAGLSKAQLTRVERLQRGRVRPGDRLVQGALRGDQGALKAYAKDYDFRMSLHQQLFDLDLISEDTFKRGLESYGPNMSQTWEAIKEQAQRGGLQLSEIIGESSRRGAKAREAGAARRAAVGEKARALEAEQKGVSITDLPAPEGGPRALGPAVEGGGARLRSRRMTDSEFAQFDRQVLDPRASLETLGHAAQLVARQRFAQKLAGSVVAQDATGMVDSALRIVGGQNAALAAMHGVSGAKLDAMQKIIGLMPRVGRQETGKEIAQLLGWKSIDELYAKIPGYAQRLPEALRGKWIDPAAAEDVVGSLEFLGEPGMMERFYKGVVNMYRAGKTALNPATHVRNGIGGVFFSHFARGGGVKLVPRKGLKAYEVGHAEYEAWREAIGAGASFSVEARDALRSSGLAAAKDGRQASSLDWLGSSRVARALQGGASKMEEFYRSIDEVWSLDTWMEVVERRTPKVGLEAARREATVQLRKFMPNYQIHSDLANAFREGPLGFATAIPFASFTTETARIWKNVLQEKPHLAFLWNHAFESMSSAFGGFAGFGQDQISEATQALPEYQQGKKMLVLPFSVDGKPSFVDMSYMIPLANLGEAQQAEGSFFGSAIDITANPLLNAGIAFATGQNAFTGREVGPAFTERQLGIPVVGEKARRLVGLGEHMAAMMLPPLLPPGYAGLNLMEAARGQTNPATGQPLEKGVFRTVMANLAGFRASEPDVSAQVQNVRREDKRRSEATSQSWERWGFARANGNEEAMAAEEQRIVELRMESGYTEGEARSYFAKSARDRGPLSNLSRRQVKEIVRRSRAIGDEGEQEQGLERRLRQMQLSALGR